MSLLLLSSVALASDMLPVQRVRFYETGVAWFERSGLVTSETTLLVPTSHLDDALKSLVVLGGDVEVGAITFPSTIGDDAAMAEAGLSDGIMGFEQVLSTMLGGPIDVVRLGGEHVRGMLLDVTPIEVPEGSSAPLPYALTVLADDGAVLRILTADIASIGAEGELSGRLRRAAQTLGPSRAMRPAGIDLQMWRGGSVSLGYVAEAPVWQVTYRVISSGGERAHLQAWAIVHNDTEEDWREVKLELANGEPDSFVNPLVAPRYAEREVHLPDDNLSTLSQLGTSTPDQLSSGMGYGVGYGTSAGYGGSGSAAGLGGVGTMGVALAALKQAEPVETPTQFVYRVSRPVDLSARHSALVPLVHEDIDVENLVAFLPGVDEGRTGLWLKNTTKKTLPDGIVSVLDGGGLAGEGQLERLKPDESQLLLFGNELDIDIVRTEEELTPVPIGLRWEEGLVVTQALGTDHTASLTNRSGRTQSVWLALELGPESDVVSGHRTVIDPHVGYTWAVVDAAAGGSVAHIRTDRHEDEPRSLESIATDEIRAWSKAHIADASVLRTALGHRESLDALDAESATIREEQARASAQGDNLRRDLGAAPDSDALARKVSSIEEELRRLSERLADIEAKQAAVLEEMSECFQLLAPAE